MLLLMAIVPVALAITELNHPFKQATFFTLPRWYLTVEIISMPVLFYLRFYVGSSCEPTSTGMRIVASLVAGAFLAFLRMVIYGIFFMFMVVLQGPP
jgi:hypothetical protein